MLDPAPHDAALVQKDRFCHKNSALACNRQSIKAQEALMIDPMLLNVAALVCQHHAPCSTILLQTQKVGL